MEESFHNLQLVPQNHDKWCTSDVLSKLKVESDSVSVNMQLWVNELILVCYIYIYCPFAGRIHKQQTNEGLIHRDVFRGCFAVCLWSKKSIDFHQKRNLNQKVCLSSPFISLHVHPFNYTLLVLLLLQTHLTSRSDVCIHDHM